MAAGRAVNDETAVLSEGVGGQVVQAVHEGDGRG